MNGVGHRLFLLAWLSAAAITPAAEGLEVGGRVLAPGGLPLPGAEIRLLPLAEGLDEARRLLDGAESEPTHLVRTDDRGRFRLVAPGAGLWRLRVSAPGCVALEARLQPLIEPLVLPDAQLLDDAGMTVTVSDDAGKPVAGAEVLAHRDDDGARFRREVWIAPLRGGRTDGDGKLRLAREAREALSISVSAAGHTLAEVRGRLGDTARVRLGRGKDWRLAVHGAGGATEPQVLVGGGELSHPLARTAADGVATLTVDPQRPLALQLVAADGRRLTSRVEPVVLRRGDDAPYRLTLPARALVSGRLIDSETRKPIEGGLIWDSERPLQGATSDGAGGFALGGARGLRLRLRAAAAGYLEAPEFAWQFHDDDRPGPTLALRPAAALEGRVLDDAGQGVDGAALEVAVRSDPGSMRIEFGGGADLPRTVSDARGAYRLGPLDPELRYSVTARAEGFAAAERTVAGLEPYRTRSGLDLALERGQRLSGRVTDADGRPLRDAEVTLAPGQSADGFGPLRMVAADTAAAPGSATTDGEGRFEIRGLRSGAFDVTIRRAGFAKRSLPGVELPAGDEAVDLGVVVLEPGQRVQGRVNDPAGRPLEGVEIFVRPAGPELTFMAGMPGAGSREEPDAVSDPSGWFVVSDLAAGEACRLDLSRSGYLTRQVQAITPPRSEPVEVVLHPSSLVTGFVRDAAAEPIAGAEVRLQRRETMELGGNVMMMLAMEDTRSDAEGRFRFENQPPGKIGLSALASGFQKTERQGLEVPEGQDLVDVELRLESGSIVEGRVLGSDGRAVIGAEVRVVDENEGPMRFPGRPTDGNGVYRLEGLAPATVSIEATHDDYPRAVRDIELREGVNLLDLQFAGGHAVSGRVLDAAGEGLPGAVVRLGSAGRPWGGPETRTEAGGAFELPGVRDGEYALWVEAEGFSPLSGERQVVVAGHAVSGLELRLDRGATVSGAIRGLEPERFRELSVQAQGPNFSGFRHSGVDRRGEYRLEHLAAGDYVIEATLADTGRQARSRLTLEPGQTEARADLDFEAGLTLSGVAVEGEAPIAGATVLAEGVDIDRGGWAQTDLEGRFRIEGLEVGSYEIRLRNFQTGLNYEERVELATSREIELRVPTARVAGQVIDGADRRPLGGALLTLNRAGGERMFPAHSASSDADGAFEFGNIADGNWQLQAGKQGYAAANREVQVQFGRLVGELRLALEPTEGLTLEVRLPSGAAPEEIRAAVLDPAGQPLLFGNYATGENGRVRLSSVPAGQWQVVVAAEGSATTSLTASAPGPAVPVALSAAARLRVTVPELTGSETIVTATLRDSAGMPYRDLGWNGTPQGEWRLSGGRIDFVSLPPGNWSVAVEAFDGRRWEGTATLAPGALQELRLE